MILISHRGNVEDILPDQENTPTYIDKAINLGYDVEIDIHLVNDILFLGHDMPDYQITLNWLIDRKNNIWVHTKNFAALSNLIKYNLRIFFHQKENHTIINNSNLIWSHNLIEADENSIIPLLSLKDIKNFNNKKVYGVCSDYVSTLKGLLK